MSNKSTICPLQSLLCCKKCQNYLVIPPIFATPNGYICGRCDSNTEINKIRALAYENLAKLFKYPCRNQQYGCDKLTQFNNDSHESVCSFNGFKCPTLTECNDIVRVADLVKHYELKHQDLIIPQNFQISQKSNLESNKLFVLNNMEFILQLIVVKNQHCSLTLYHLRDKKLNLKYCVEVKAENHKTLILNQYKVNKFKPDIRCIENSTIINFGIIKQVLSATNFNFKLHLIQPPIVKPVVKSESPKPTITKPDDMEKWTSLKPTTITTPNNENKENLTASTSSIREPTKDDFLEELECVICKEYMTPPIFVCKIGHSVCNQCKQRIKQCPTCKASYEGTRNIVLERLTEHVSYPCRNYIHGCKFADKLIQLREHEKNCMRIDCPFYNLDKNCTYKGGLNTIYQHCQQVHPHRLFNSLNQEISRNIKVSPVRDLYVVKYDGTLFTITIDHGLCSMVLWAVEQIDLIDKQFKYKFIVDFIDKTNQGRILTISGLCHSYKQNDPFANTVIKLPDYLLKPFMDANDILHFKLDIKKL